MNIEFHYYMTYLIAARAGYSPDEAHVIAYAGEFVDENQKKITINQGKKSQCTSTPTQACDPPYPMERAGQIGLYSIFHFIPGDPYFKGAARKDGKIHVLNTTPDSTNAQKIFDKALETGDLYRIGIAAHGYVDTWAHQNFIGCVDDFNHLSGVTFPVILKKWDLMKLGHADAYHSPDYPMAVWTDPRLVNDTIDNQRRFIEAAESLFWRLGKICGKHTADQLGGISSSLSRDFISAMGERDDGNAKAQERIKRYIALSKRPEYGGTELIPFRRGKGDWFDTAVESRVRRGDEERTSGATASGTYDYFWRNEEKRSSTDWYKFQEAARRHLKESIEILSGAVPIFGEVLAGDDVADNDERLIKTYKQL